MTAKRYSPPTWRLAIPFALLLVACDPPRKWTRDQCVRQQQFASCMAALPVGPSSTKYNDWDDVVDSCRSFANEVSLRLVDQVSPECREQ